MPYAIQAIETLYKAIAYRSRLEARWAVFFDALDIKYEYEKEGYDLGASGWYLPDFWLPQYGIWVEIKGQEATKREIEKCKALALGTQTHVFLLSGLPEYDVRSSCCQMNGWVCFFRTFAEYVDFFMIEEEDEEWEFGSRAIAHQHKANGGLVSLYELTSFDSVESKNGIPIKDRFEASEQKRACAASRSARFERGAP